MRRPRPRPLLFLLLSLSPSSTHGEEVCLLPFLRTAFASTLAGAPHSLTEQVFEILNRKLPGQLLTQLEGEWKSMEAAAVKLRKEGIDFLAAEPALEAYRVAASTTIARPKSSGRALENWRKADRTIVNAAMNKTLEYFQSRK